MFVYFPLTLYGFLSKVVFWNDTFVSVKLGHIFFTKQPPQVLALAAVVVFVYDADCDITTVRDVCLSG